MGGVVDGSAVSAAVTNPAFLDANGDDTALGKIDFAEASFASGPTVVNIQREVNSLDSYTGRTAGSAFNAQPTFANSQGLTATESLTARAEELSAKFHNSTGHAHSGSAGDGSPIASASLAGVPLKGYVKQSSDLSAVTGTSVDVSSLFISATPSTGPTIVGVVTNNPENKTILRQATGASENDDFKDLLGNVVYGRLTESAGVWTLSFYVDISGTETAYSFTAANIRWYYQQLFNPMLNPPVYSEFANIPSDNVTQDVVDASTSQKGKVLLSSSSIQPVGASSSEGTANATVANANHAHEGIHAIQEFSEAVNVFGDIILKGAGSTTITRSGNTFTITAGGGLTPVQESTQAGQSPDGARVNFDLSYVPYSTDSLLVFLDGLDVPKSLWSLTSSTVTFGTAPAAAQDLKFYYFKSGAVVTSAVAPKTEFRTISSGEATAKALTLIQTPSISSEVTLGISGGGFQFYGDDYTVSGTTLSWSGLGLDGVLSVGDKLVIGYFY
jgi:hypothetical protein